MCLSKFKKGEIISTGVISNPSYVIFEGKDMPSEYGNKYSVIAYYTPNKYVKNDEGHYEPTEFIEVATKYVPCEKTIDSDAPSYWNRRCNEEEKEKALSIFKKYGYEWNEEDLTLSNSNTNEIIYQIKIPKLKYNGEFIKPICKKFKNILKSFCISKSKGAKKYYNSSYYDQNYDYSRGYWERGHEDYWD